MADEKRTDGTATAASSQGWAAGSHGEVREIGSRDAWVRPIPWKGDLGKRVYDNVSKEAWRMWVEHSKMLMNEFHLNRSIRIRRRSCLRRGGQVAR